MVRINFLTKLAGYFAAKLSIARQAFTPSVRYRMSILTRVIDLRSIKLNGHGIYFALPPRASLLLVLYIRTLHPLPPPLQRIWQPSGIHYVLIGSSLIWNRALPLWLLTAFTLAGDFSIFLTHEQDDIDSLAKC